MDPITFQAGPLAPCFFQTECFQLELARVREKSNLSGAWKGYIVPIFLEESEFTDNLAPYLQALTNVLSRELAYEASGLGGSLDSYVLTAFLKFAKHVGGAYLTDEIVGKFLHDWHAVLPEMVKTYGEDKTQLEVIDEYVNQHIAWAIQATE